VTQLVRPNSGQKRTETRSDLLLLHRFDLLRQLCLALRLRTPITQSVTQTIAHTSNIPEGSVEAEKRSPLPAAIPSAVR
jgi:hypothetical protein